MSIDRNSRGYLFAGVAIAALGLVGGALLASARPAPAELNPAAIKIQLPDQIKWDDHLARGEGTAVLAGDPTKPGIYVELVKWHAHHMSHPHFHPNDRFITVISGTWWVGTGTKFDPDTTSPCRLGASCSTLANRCTVTAPRMRTQCWKSSEKAPQQPRLPKQNSDRRFIRFARSLGGWPGL